MLTNKKCPRKCYDSDTEVCWVHSRQNVKSRGTTDVHGFLFTIVLLSIGSFFPVASEMLSGSVDFSCPNIQKTVMAFVSRYIYSSAHCHSSHTFLSSSSVYKKSAFCKFYVWSLNYMFQLSVNHVLGLTNRNQFIFVRDSGNPITRSLAQFISISVNVKWVRNPCLPVKMCYTSG